jgi:ABC-type transporter Mla MlaB component
MSPTGDLASRLVYSGGGTIRCLDDAGHVTLSIEGDLDHDTASALVDSVADAVTSNPNRIDVDLCQLSSFASPGTEALGRCRDLCAELPAGLHFRTEGGPGQNALLAAFESEPPSNPG